MAYRNSVESMKWWFFAQWWLHALAMNFSVAVARELERDFFKWKLFYCDATFITWQRKPFHFAMRSWKTFWQLAFCSLCLMILVTTSIFQESFSLAQNIKERVHWGGKWRCRVGSEKKKNFVIQFETCLEVHIIRYMPISVSILLHFMLNYSSLLASGRKYRN